MARYLLRNRHRPRECGVVFASFKGHESPLRHQATFAPCRSGGHTIWWNVEDTPGRGQNTRPEHTRPDPLLVRTFFSF